MEISQINLSKKLRRIIYYLLALWIPSRILYRQEEKTTKAERLTILVSYNIHDKTQFK